MVDRVYQGHGIGRKLMEKCLEYLADHGIWVRMVRETEREIKAGEK